MENLNYPLIYAILYVILAPLAGGLLAGADRIITARMQSRVGPPVLQPFYDFFKLLQKENKEVNRFQAPLMGLHLIFMIFTGGLFFYGADLLLVIFALTLACMFLVLAANCSNSPFSFVGAERELITIMAAEPMLILTLVGFYQVTKSFAPYEIMNSDKMLIFWLPGVFLALFHVLTIKFRKSPFDISYSHHGHQELVKGITTDLSGRTMAMIEISHWYENIFLLSLVYMFFSFMPILGVFATLFIYFLELIIDNTNARAKWQLTFTSSWLVTLVLGCSNLVILYFVRS